MHEDGFEIIMLTVENLELLTNRLGLDKTLLAKRLLEDQYLGIKSAYLITPHTDD